MKNFYAIKLNNGKFHKYNLGGIVLFTNKTEAKRHMKLYHYDGEVVPVNIDVNKDAQIERLKHERDANDASYVTACKELTKLRNELSAKVEYIHELVEVKDDYKQQLAEKDKEIEYIRTMHTYKFYFGEDKVQDFRIDDAMLSIFNRDKISFCIDKLIELKDLLAKESKENPIVYDISKDIVGGAVDRDKCFALIDNQIKQLKEK